MSVSESVLVGSKSADAATGLCVSNRLLEPGDRCSFLCQCSALCDIKFGGMPSASRVSRFPGTTFAEMLAPLLIQPLVHTVADYSTSR